MAVQTAVKKIELRTHFSLVARASKLGGRLIILLPPTAYRDFVITISASRVRQRNTLTQKIYPLVIDQSAANLWPHNSDKNCMVDVLNMSVVNVPGLAEKLQSRFNVLISPDCSVPAGADSIRALIPGKAPVDACLLDSLPNLEIISLVGAGYDRVDVATAAGRGIAVTNTPDVLTDDVADLAIALIIMVARRLREGDRLVRAGGWQVKDPVFGHAIKGKTLGILGLGRIGRAIAQRALAMDMEISYTNRNKADAPYRFVPDLVQLARESDFLVVAAAAGADTQYIVNREVIEALGPDGILINIARGSMVDEAALADALANGRLGGAGLDVFEHEPHVHAKLLTFDNVVLTPHIGSATVETRSDMGNMVIANLVAHFEGRPLVSEVPESIALRRP